MIQVATDPAPPMPFRLTATGLRLRGDWTVTLDAAHAVRQSQNGHPVQPAI